MEILNELIKNDLWLLQWVALLTSITNLSLMLFFFKTKELKKVDTTSIGQKWNFLWGKQKLVRMQYGVDKTVLEFRRE